jgi:hypothetical protein
MSENGKVEKERALVLEKLVTLVPEDMEAASMWPILHDLLMPRYKEGVCTRVGASLRIRAQGTCWLVTVDCETEGVQMALACDSLHDLFTQLEKALCNNRVRWSENYATAKKRRQAHSK